MNRRRNVIIVLAGVLVVIVLGVVVAKPKAPVVTARIATARLSDFETRLPETGYVQRPRTETLAALVAGNLGSLSVRPGEHVAAGQIVATIDNPQIVNAERTAHDAYLAAAGRARSAGETQVAVPAQNRSAIVQAEAQLQQARFSYSQAVQDERAGAQSGLGYGGSSASQQRAAAAANVAKATTDLREAKRVYDADAALLAQSAIARNQVDTDRARLDQAQVTYDQALRDRNETEAQLARQQPVLSDRVRSARDGVQQAEAALAAARAASSKSGAGDVQAAQGDAQGRLDDWRYAQDQAARLVLRAPFAGIVQSIATQPSDATRPLQPGDSVTVGQALVTLAAGDRWVVRAKVDEQDVAQIAIGARAHVGGEDLGGRTLDGTVVAINATAQKSDDPSNTARQVVTTIALAHGLPFLKDGMTVDVDLVTKRVAHAVVVPADAIRRDDPANPKIVEVRNGVAHLVPVKLGPSNDAQAVVTSGLAVGDQYVSERGIGVIEGTHVTPAPTPSASASP